MVMCLEVFLTSIQSNKIVSKIINIFFLKALQKYYQILIHGYFIHVWPLPSKTIMPTCRNFDVIYMQKMNSIPVFFFFRYCKNIANLLHWVLSECLIKPINNDSITLQETLMLICMQKINFIFNLFIEIL